MSAPPPTSTRGGIISLFAKHPTAANLVMVLMLVSGIAALTKLNTQFFPDFGIDIVTVSVTWRGATAEDVDQNVVQAIEPEVRFLAGVKRVISTSSEGVASLLIEFEPGSDMQAALSEVEQSVAQVTTLPEDSEPPRIRRIVRYEQISRIVVSGPYPEAALKAFAKRMRDDLLDRGIDKVDIDGTRDEEIWVEIPEETLRRLDVTLADVADKIEDASQDVPSGDLGGGARQVRSLGLKKDAEGIGEIELKSFNDGRKILLRDVADVSDTFEEGGRTARRRGQPAVELVVQRALTADALQLTGIVNTYLDETRPTLPSNLRVEQYDIQADLIRDRVDLLLRNGLGGLILVLAILFLFLNARVAFWVAVGIPTSLAATLAVMLGSGQSINMISLWGMIMAIGIVVDDAIVVGEHAEARARKGMNSVDAAVSGAQRMAPPVFSSSLTTCAAFLPLFVIAGIIGDIIVAIPLVVVTVILASLIECFLVLPGHMRHALKERPESNNVYTRFRRGFDRRFDAFRDGPYRRMVEAAIHWRYATIAGAFGCLILCVGLIAGGRVGFHFFPSPESDKIYANLEMTTGTSRDQTAAALDQLEAALDRTVAELASEDDAGTKDLVAMAVQKLGMVVGTRGANAALETATDTLGGIVVTLKPSDQRSVRTAAFIQAWRARVPAIPGLESLSILAAQGGPPGRDVDVRLRGGSVTALKDAAEEVKALLARYSGVSDIEDDLPYGKPETVIEVTPRGQALGFDTASVGRQVRNAIDGAVAKRFPRGDEEVTVRVQYPRDQIDGGVLDRLYLRAPEGAEVPLGEVVAMRDSAGFATVLREDGRRQVSVTAELDAAVTGVGDIIVALERDGLAEIAERFGLNYTFKGKAEEQADTFADMKLGGILGLAGIYIVLAWVFASYWRPLAVMLVIPLGFIGAVAGHWVMGFALTILSMVALIGLSGIVINDSIVLVTTIDERKAAGQNPIQAIVDGSCDRLRAVILTSATTIGGLLPLIFERSLQAQFLIPMALTIVSGLAVATVLVLVVVPALIGVQEDIGRLLFGRDRSRDLAMSTDGTARPDGAFARDLRDAHAKLGSPRSGSTLPRDAD